MGKRTKLSNHLESAILLSCPAAKEDEHQPLLNVHVGTCSLDLTGALNVAKTLDKDKAKENDYPKTMIRVILFYN